MRTQTITPTGRGENLKTRALTTLEARRRVYVNRGRRALLGMLLRHGHATADDVRNAVDLPPDVDPVCFGAVPGALARAGIIERAGFKSSVRADAHARPVSVWRLVDRDAALAWLDEHPDMPDPDDDHDGDGQRTLFDPPVNAPPDAATSGGPCS